jgi:hypothetical protein
MYFTFYLIPSLWPVGKYFLKISVSRLYFNIMESAVGH